MTTVGYLTTVCVRQFCLKKKKTPPKNAMLLFSGVSPYAKTTIILNHIHAHHTPPHSHVFLFFMPSAEEQKMRSRKVLKSLCRRASSSSSSSTKHTRRLSCGGKTNPHKQPPSHAIYACLFVSLFPFPFVPFSPGSVRFDSFLMQVAMIVKLWNFQKKNRGKRKQQETKKRIRWKKNKEKRSSRGQRSVGPWISSSSVCQKKIKNLLPSNIATWPNESS